MLLPTTEHGGCESDEISLWSDVGGLGLSVCSPEFLYPCGEETAYVVWF